LLILLIISICIGGIYVIKWLTRRRIEKDLEKAEAKTKRAENGRILRIDKGRVNLILQIESRRTSPCGGRSIRRDPRIR
jgi:hypothetical protein